MSDFRTPAWLRVSDADRQAVADQLSQHFGDGRLDQAEFDERLGRAMSAKTYRDLDGLLTDLPSTQASGGAGLPPAGGAGLTSRAPGSVPQRRAVRPVLLIVAAVIAISIADHALAWAVGGWLWIGVIALIVLAFARRSRRPSYHDTTK
jgi:hypothetical protein